jgi:hypothetical protein
MSRVRSFRRMWRILIAVGAAFGVFVAVVGVAHTPWGRPLLVFLPGMKVGCPVGYGKPIAPADWDWARLIANRENPSRDASKNAPALGFEFGTPKGEIEAWAKGVGVSCEPTRRETALRCALGKKSLREGGPAFDEVTFGFDGSSVLVYLDATVSGAFSETSTAFNDSARYLAEQLGSPTHSEGSADRTYLTEARLRQAAQEYRYANYRAKLTATNLAPNPQNERIRVRALFESLPQG